MRGRLRSKKEENVTDTLSQKDEIDMTDSNHMVTMLPEDDIC